MAQHAHAIDAGHQARQAHHHHHDHAATPRGQSVPTGHAGHGGHHDHSAMVGDFRRRFWISLALTPPILLLSPVVQHFIGLEFDFAGRGLVLMLLSSFVHFYGGRPFLAGFASEISKRQPA